jgi:hypothetical protein
MKGICSLIQAYSNARCKKNINIMRKRKLVLMRLLPVLAVSCRLELPHPSYLRVTEPLLGVTKLVNPPTSTQRVENCFIPASQISCRVWYGVPSHNVNICSESGDSANSRCLSLLFVPRGWLTGLSVCEIPVGDKTTDRFTIYTSNAAAEMF